MKRLAAKRVQAALEYSRSRSLLPVRTLDSIVSPDPGPRGNDMQPVEKAPHPASQKKRAPAAEKSKRIQQSSSVEESNLPKTTRTGRCVTLPQSYR